MAGARAAPVRGFYHHSAVWTGDEMVVWGWVSGTTGEENEAAAYDPATDTWRSCRRPRCAHRRRASDGGSPRCGPATGCCCRPLARASCSSPDPVAAPDTCP